MLYTNDVLGTFEILENEKTPLLKDLEKAFNKHGFELNQVVSYDFSNKRHKATFIWERVKGE